MDKLEQQKQKLTATQTGILMMTVTVFGFLFGFGREIALSNFFGTTYVIDAYNVANSIPGILFGGIFSAIGTAYMPTFSKITEKEGVDKGKGFTDRLITLVVIAAIVCAAIGIVFSNFLIKIVAPGFTGQTAKLASIFLKIIFCYNIFSGITGILNSYLRYNGVFVRQIIIAYLNDIGIIIGAIAATYLGYIYIAIGVLCGRMLECLATIVLARKHEFKYRLNFKFGQSVKEIIILAIPVFIGSMLSQINTFIDKLLASSLPEGSIAALGFGGIIPASLVALTASIIATILYPKITKAVNTGDNDYLNVMSKKSITVAAMIVLPFSLGSAAFSSQVVQVIFERGAFSTASTDITASAMFFYSFGMLFIAINNVCVQIAYSLKDMRLPLYCGVASVCTNIALNLLLIGPMKHNGLALATSVANMVSAVSIVFLLRRRHPELRVFPTKVKLVKIVICSAAAVAIAILVYKLMTIICIVRTINLIIAVGASVIAYLISLKIARIEEIDILTELIPKKNR